jgi:hypothetical protein
MNLRNLILSLTVAGAFCAPALSADETPKSAAKPAKHAAACPEVSGSRIRPRIENDCKGAKPFRSYSQEDLQRTGEIDINEALRKLDPIFH